MATVERNYALPPPSARAKELKKKLRSFMEEHVTPAEAVWAEQLAGARSRGRQWKEVSAAP